MNNKLINGLLVIFLAGASCGCVVRTYQVTRDRVDQDLSAGNHGYLSGTAEEENSLDRKATRDTRVVEIELRSPLRFDSRKADLAADEPVRRVTASDQFPAEAAQPRGNRGFITESREPDIIEYPDQPGRETILDATREYTVQENDTLQKISQKFFATTKKWNLIFEANKSILKSPNSIYPGQIIAIPIESMQEPADNLK